MSVTTKRQRDLAAKMKWPPCPIETADPVPPIVPDGVSFGALEGAVCDPKKNSKK